MCQNEHIGEYFQWQVSLNITGNSGKWNDWNWLSNNARHVGHTQYRMKITLPIANPSIPEKERMRVNADMNDAE
jgi:hypothetical protein